MCECVYINTHTLGYLYVYINARSLVQYNQRQLRKFFLQFSRFHAYLTCLTLLPGTATSLCFSLQHIGAFDECTDICQSEAPIWTLRGKKQFLKRLHFVTTTWRHRFSKPNRLVLCVHGQMLIKSLPFGISFSEAKTPTKPKC